MKTNAQLQIHQIIVSCLQWQRCHRVAILMHTNVTIVELSCRRQMTVTHLLYVLQVTINAKIWLVSLVLSNKINVLQRLLVWSMAYHIYAVMMGKRALILTINVLLRKLVQFQMLSAQMDLVKRLVRNVFNLQVAFTTGRAVALIKYVAMMGLVKRHAKVHQMLLWIALLVNINALTTLALLHILIALNKYTALALHTTLICMPQSGAVMDPIYAHGRWKLVQTCSATVQLVTNFATTAVASQNVWLLSPVLVFFSKLAPKALLVTMSLEWPTITSWWCIKIQTTFVRIRW